MNSELSLCSILLLLCAGQGLFLAYALIFSKNNNRLANRYLGFFTLLVAITVADASLFNADGGESILALRSVLWPRDYLYGPVLYFYVREMTRPRSCSSNSWQWLHFLPAMIHAALFWSLPFFNGPIHYAILTLEADSAMPYLGLVETMLNVEISTAILHLTIYLWLSVRLLIHHDRPYLDSQLSLPGLAQQLDVSVNQLSQIINEQLQQNFFDFVNKYRIAEAKAQLQAVDQRHRNILTVATDVGFNSKTAFYTALKKHTGMTPGEFRGQTGSHLAN